MIMDLIRRLFGLAGSYESRAVRPENPNEILAMVKEIKKEMAEMRSAIAEHKLAIEVLRDHDSRKPEGIKARLTGERREWERDRQGYAATEAAKQGKEIKDIVAAAKGWQPPTKAEAAVEANEAVADLNEAPGLRGFGGRR